jgi:hypothetical protein
MNAARALQPTAADGAIRISIGRRHEGQRAAYQALLPHRFRALRCGRRFGKTELAKSWIKQGLIQGEPCAWFAPQHMQSLEVYHELALDLAPVWTSGRWKTHPLAEAAAIGVLLSTKRPLPKTETDRASAP